MATSTAPRGLHTLARLHGVQTAYHDNDGQRVPASPEALLAALRGLRVPVGDTGVIPRLVSERRRQLWERVVDPVVVAWVHDGGDTTGSFLLRLPTRLRDQPVRVEVGLEDGGEREWSPAVESLEPRDEAEVHGIHWVAREVILPALPAGYHDLCVEVGEGRGRSRHRSLLIAAPRRARGWDVLGTQRGWGVFAPLYALRERERDDRLPGVEVPTYGDLARLAERVADAGGSAVGTLPLLAAFLGDRPYEPSPYSPVSRLFWNELYTDPLRALELAGVERVQEAAPYAMPPVRPRLFEREDGPEPLREQQFVDGRRVDPRVGMAFRRRPLETLARRFFRAGDPPELESFRARNPRVDDYARFRALAEEHGAWPQWPDRLRARDVRDGDVDAERVRYHVYVQWLAERQLAEAREQAESRGVGLYLDLPLGVHPDGYDVWRERELFAAGMSAGAPPDALAAGGQDWGFPPMHPDASREDGHRYFVSSIRKHLRFARVLRIDHVMQLHRMYWVPGGDARNGVYVRYPARELYAVLCLESHRAGAVVVGEDLGTVPRAARRGMKRHGLPGMYVAQFELTDTTVEGPDGERRPGLEPRDVKGDQLASINTHDTPTFAGWWFGRDIEIRRELGQIEEEQAEAELRGRGEMREKLVRGLAPSTSTSTSTNPADADADAAYEVQRELLRRMGRSSAGLVLATMEDLWLEREPQNVPGTTGEWNWRRRSARPLSALEEPGPAGLLGALNEARKGTNG